MKYLKKVETLPTKLEEGVLYYAESDNKIAVKKKPSIEIVDLGLSVNWMTCNIGATKPEEYGLFFQWGGTVGYEDASHSTWSTAPFNNGSSSYDATYFASVSGDVCPNGVLASQYDAASVATNGVAHMPTQADFNELTANTTVEWVTDYNGSGINGRKFTASNGNYIFIPASGYANSGSVYGRGTNGYVWSSSLYSSTPYDAWYLYFTSSGMGVDFDFYRCIGRSVRGVVSK